MSERQQAFEDQERQRLAAEAANRDAREALAEKTAVTPRPPTPTKPTITPPTQPVRRRGAAFKPKKTITDVANNLIIGHYAAQQVMFGQQNTSIGNDTLDIGQALVLELKDKKIAYQDPLLLI